MEDACEECGGQQTVVRDPIHRLACSRRRYGDLGLEEIEHSVTAGKWASKPPTKDSPPEDLEAYRGELSAWLAKANRLKAERASIDLARIESEL